MKIINRDILMENIYLQQMFKKYECIPTKLKYMFIEKDYTQMFGSKREAESRMSYMYDNTETFIFAFENALCEFNLTKRRNLIKKYWEDLALHDYIKIADSGSYFKYYSGNWKKDKQYFIDKIAEKEDKKEYVKMIDLKRLHQVHKDYPNTLRRQGKTTYCFDKLLRTAQLETVKEQVYITNTQQATFRAFKDFMYFLSNSEEKFSYSLKDFKVFIGECEIKFISLAGKERLKGNYNYFTEDYF